jgi:hypothetical protein
LGVPSIVILEEVNYIQIKRFFEQVFFFNQSFSFKQWKY